MARLTQEEMKALEFKEINTNHEPTEPWMPYEGDELIGEYTEKREDCGADGYTFYIVDDGATKYSILSNTVISSIFDDLEIGDIIKIRYNGYRKSLQKNREYRDYTLFKAMETASSEDVNNDNDVENKTEVDKSKDILSPNSTSDVWDDDNIIDTEFKNYQI